MNIHVILVGSLIFPSFTGTLKSVLIKTWEDGFKYFVKC
jgi:hypothetical protein